MEKIHRQYIGTQQVWYERIYIDSVMLRFTHMVWYGNKYRRIVVGKDLLMKFSGVGCNLAV